MVQKPMEERGENCRKHVVKKCWTKDTEYPRRGCNNETAGRHDNDQWKSCKIPWKMGQQPKEMVQKLSENEGDG